MGVDVSKQSPENAPASMIQEEPPLSKPVDKTDDCSEASSQFSYEETAPAQAEPTKSSVDSRQLASVLKPLLIEIGHYRTLQIEVSELRTQLEAARRHATRCCENLRVREAVLEESTMNKDIVDRHTDHQDTLLLHACNAARQALTLAEEQRIAIDTELQNRDGELATRGLHLQESLAQAVKLDVDESLMLLPPLPPPKPRILSNGHSPTPSTVFSFQPPSTSYDPDLIQPLEAISNISAYEPGYSPAPELISQTGWDTGERTIDYEEPELYVADLEEFKGVQADSDKHMEFTILGRLARCIPTAYRVLKADPGSHLKKWSTQLRRVRAARALYQDDVVAANGSPNLNVIDDFDDDWTSIAYAAGSNLDRTTSKQSSLDLENSSASSASFAVKLDRRRTM